MKNQVRLSIVLHNHQPIGNFDGVIEAAYQDSYLPFLNIFEPFEHLRVGLHTSGPLMLWLADNHPEYLERVKTLVQDGRIEIIGGPFYEPILTMLPSRDRIGQIQKYTQWLQNRFHTAVSGMWMPERVWESQLIRDIVPAGMQYTILDDFHFRAAGWSDTQLNNYYLTEDDGHVLRVFPGSEQLRYLIPFGTVNDIIQYCREMGERTSNPILVFGDDGEKFGTWPDTKQHVYERGWLQSFFEALTNNRDWLRTATPAEIITESPPAGTVYLPDCSYREMTEWALPVEKQSAYDSIVHELQSDSRWPQIRPFLRGGYWRNFRVKYTEANEMYCRMLEVSRRLEFARRSSNDKDLIKTAEEHLYRAQCNCPYWHGAFGGIYLPHLRNATYKELIAADNAIDRMSGLTGEWVEVSTDDFDKDLFPEVRLSNDQLIAYFAPARGGMLYELDVRGIEHNLLATIQRRPEPYHVKVQSGASENAQQAASIHDRVVFKQEGLAERLLYDRSPRKSLIDHFFDENVTAKDVQSGAAMERGDFFALPYDAKLRRASSKIQTQLRREGNAWGIPLAITKGITLYSGSHALEITYLVEGLPPGKRFHFAVETNFAGMPSHADDRFFYDANAERLGHLGSVLDLGASDYLGLIDQWLGANVQFTFNRPTSMWCFPIETVSQSESGFESVHQSVCVMPHWMIEGDRDGRWSVSMDLIVTCEHEPNSRSTQLAAAYGR
ncbi:MAG: alpha-amylase/4-alpha-glucanotransferase domain-containing protein [Pirellula sp.]